MASMSSASGTTSSNNAECMIRDFKRKINERHTPKVILNLNRLIFGIILSTLLLTIVDFVMLKGEIEGLSGENKHNLMSERRTLEFLELAINTRSWLNTGNGIEVDYYDLDSLNKLDRRFELLGRFIQSQADGLKEIHDFMT